MSMECEVCGRESTQLIGVMTCKLCRELQGTAHGHSDKCNCLKCRIAALQIENVRLRDELARKER